MLVKKVNHNTIDVFLGTGWENWSRFKIKFGKEHNQLFQVKGTRLPRAELTALQQQYNATI